MKMLLEIFFLVVFVFPTAYAFWIGAPILLTPKESIRRAFRYCQIEKGKIFYDLGSGTGRSLIIASKEFGLNATGFELSPILFIISKINLFFSGAKAKVKIKNFYQVDLGEADVVFCFLTPEVMKKLTPKFEKELKIGAKIVSYAFRISQWEPVKIINTDNPGKIFIYENIQKN